MMIRDFFVFVAAGIALHQTASITQKMANGWGYLAGIAIGVEGTYPAFVVLMKRLGLRDDVIARASAAYQLAFLSIGIGVALGWLFDTLFGVDRSK